MHSMSQLYGVGRSLEKYPIVQEIGRSYSRTFVHSRSTTAVEVSSRTEGRKERRVLPTAGNHQYRLIPEEHLYRSGSTRHGTPLQYGDPFTADRQGGESEDRLPARCSIRSAWTELLIAACRRNGLSPQGGHLCPGWAGQD